MISIVIAVYKRLDFLELVLLSLRAQHYTDFEVIIAEDARDQTTAEFVIAQRNKCKFPLLHVSHADQGFRKTTILNEAVYVSEGDKLVFIDGDCILHPDFLGVYAESIKPGYFYYARRTRLSQAFTEKLIKTKDIGKITLINLFLTRSKYLGLAIYLPFSIGKNKQSRQIWGCNWGVSKASLFSVNGFDEDYNEACAGEDLDIDWRLKALGLKIKSLKNRAIEYHLEHKANYNPEVQLRMEALMAEKIKAGNYVCLNGLNNHYPKLAETN